MDISLQELAEKLKTSDEYRIVYHIRPDGDCIGSAFALALGLQSIANPDHKTDCGSSVYGNRHGYTLFPELPVTIYFPDSIIKSLNDDESSS